LKLEYNFPLMYLWSMAPHKLKRPTRGGARPGSGRRRKERRAVSARISNALYNELQRQAEARGMPLSTLIESILKEVVAYPKEHESDAWLMLDKIR
jgi:hypothetical protein